jgi:AcrR family transcriptional regulator
VTTDPSAPVTAALAVDPSAPPVRERGLRSRAGNAMARTRAALLDGAARAVEKNGARKATMGDIATLAGIAKGTLYNHFRTKDAVFRAALESGIRSLGAEAAAAAADDLAGALALAAERLATTPALCRVAAEEPAVLAPLLQPGGGALWEVARDAVRGVLGAAGRDTSGPPVELVLRWLVSFVGAGERAGVPDEAALLAAALPAAAPCAGEVAADGQGT